MINSLKKEGNVENDSNSENEKVQYIESSDSKSSKNFLVMDLFDIFNYEKLEKEKLFFNSSISVADTLVFNFPWFHFQFPNSIGYQKIRKLIQTLKEMPLNTGIPCNKSKTFVFALRDFDMEQKNIQEKITSEITSELGKNSIGIQASFFFLPHAFRNSQNFNEVLSKFNDFLISQKKENDFPEMESIQIDEKIESFIKGISKVSSKKTFLEGNLNNKEMIGYRICNEIFLKTLFSFKGAIEPWKICCEEGGIIQNFGKEADILIEDYIKKFEEETGVFKSNNVFLSKKKILKFNLLSSLQEIFEKQIYKLKELSFQSFKEALSSIQVTGDVENQVNAAIQITEKYFISKVDSLKPPQAKKVWSSEKERKELVNGIREMATERLQAARLQGVYLKKTKNPISLSFYYLHPHPFGKDLRLDHMTLSDSLGYNPDLTKRAGLMRQFVATRGDSKKVSPGIENNNKEEDFIYQEEPMKSFQNNSR